MATTARAKTPTPPRTRYEDDVYTWVQEQVALLRAGRMSEIDAENIAEELADVGKALVDELEETIVALTKNLLVWDNRPEQRARSHEAMVRMHRRQIQHVLDDNPGISAVLPEAIEEGYAIGRLRALGALGLADEALPEACLYTFDDMMTREIVFEK